jgi:hypothetical protein
VKVTDTVTLLRTMQEKLHTSKSMSSSEVILQALQALNAGDFTIALDGNTFNTATDRAIANEINDLATQHKNVLNEYERIQKSCRAGDLTTRVALQETATGDWVKYATTVNKCLDATTEPLKEMLAGINSVRNGNLEWKPKFEHSMKGEFLRAHESITDLMEMLKQFTDEVTGVISNLGQGEMGATVC